VIFSHVRNEPFFVADPRYSLIIPAHNEAARIGRTLTGYLEAFADSEVLLVLNGCTDDTESVARQAAHVHGNLRIICIEHAVGKGGAVRAGFVAAKAPIVGYVDADGATPPEEMRRLFDSLGEEDDAVIASRWSKGAEVVVAQPIIRRLSSRVFNAIVKILFGLPFHDTQCGAKVFSSEAISRISNALEISNFAFDIDLLYGLRRAGSRVREMPTRWHDIDGSRIANLPRASFEMLLAVVRLRLRHSLFRYIIPILDRLWPTTTLRVRHGLAVLIIGLHDPESPERGESERYLREVGAGLVRHGHRVHWLAAGFPNSVAVEDIDGIAVRRVGNRFSARSAIPLHYVRNSRDRYDVVVEVQNGFPLLSPLFSLKPKVCLTGQPRPRGRRGATSPLRLLADSSRRRILRSLYGSARFIAFSSEHKQFLRRLGVDEARIEQTFNREAGAGDAASAHDAAIQTFLNAMYTAVSRDHSSYVLSDSQWEIVPRRSRLDLAARSIVLGRGAETF
jgi:glycosyltransferase involved in cell wall biosynthesis